MDGIRGDVVMKQSSGIGRTMNTMLIKLSGKSTDAEDLYPYVVTSDGQTANAKGHAAIGNLPPNGKTAYKVAVIVPAERLSWHRVELPPGINIKSTRLRAVLEGILEERLLDAPELLHFAIEPESANKNLIWVVACDKGWLQMQTRMLEQAGYPASVILPEFEPEQETTQVHFCGDAAAPRMVICNPEGVTVLPATAESVKLARHCAAAAKDLVIAAPPELVDLAGILWGVPINIAMPEQRLLSRLRSSWNLAQFGFATSSSGRQWKRFEERLTRLALDRQWQGLRWGLAMLLIVNVAGLNAWAWKEASLIAAKQSLVHEVFSRTFPRVSPIIDPALQMEREVAALKRTAGILSGKDMEAMLGVLAAEAPPARIPANLDFASQELKAKGLALKSAEISALTSRLQKRGYVTHIDGDQLTMKAEAGK